MISLYYGGLFIPGFLIDLVLLVVIIKSISVCYTNNNIAFEFILFWALTVTFIYSIFYDMTISNLTLYFIYFTTAPIILLGYGIFIIRKHEKK